MPPPTSGGSSYSSMPVHGPGQLGARGTVPSAGPGRSSYGKGGNPAVVGTAAGGYFMGGETGLSMDGRRGGGVASGGGAGGGGAAVSSGYVEGARAPPPAAGRPGGGKGGADATAVSELGGFTPAQEQQLQLWAELSDGADLVGGNGGMGDDVEVRGPSGRASGWWFGSTIEHG